MKRVFSAVRPSGELHLGNYLGAISQWVEMQHNYDCVFAIADYHAITTDYDSETLRQKVKDHLLFYLASGLDTRLCTLFIQSKNSDHTELAWLLNSIVTTSELSRMTQFKDKSQKQKVVSAGLFNYPVLMAADILLYQTEIVPVGEDQVQHVEMAAQIAKRFNHRFGAEIFKIPQVKIVKEKARIMSLTNPNCKMSKEGEDKSRINLSDPDDVIMQKIKSAVTDSGKEIEYKEDKPAISNLLRIYSTCSDESIEEIVAKFKDKGYANFKNALAEVIIRKIGSIRDKKEQIDNKDLFEKIAAEGLEKAKIISFRTLREAKTALGMI